MATSQTTAKEESNNPLKALLDKHELRQRQLASHLDIADSQVNRWCREDNDITPRRFYRREIVAWLRMLDIEVEETDLWDLKPRKQKAA